MGYSPVTVNRKFFLANLKQEDSVALWTARFALGKLLLFWLTAHKLCVCIWNLMPPNRVSNVLIWHRKLLCICGMWFWVVWHDWPMRWGSSAHVCRLSLATSMSLSIISGIKSANYVLNILLCNFQCWFKISTCKTCGPKQYQSLVQRRYKNTSLNSMSFLPASKPAWSGHGKCIASEISIIFLAKTPEIAESFLRLLFFSFSFVFFVFCLCLLIDLFLVCCGLRQSAAA